jgi:hypothetical protein
MEVERKNRDIILTLYAINMRASHYIRVNPKQLAAIVLILLPFILFSQTNPKDKSKEIGLVVGTSYYIGDLNQQHFGGRLHPGGGLMFRNNLNRRWSLRGSVIYSKFGAYDADSPDYWQRNRNLHFENVLIEGSFVAELNYFEYQVGDKNDFISPFLFLGLSYYDMTPKAELNGNWYELAPLGTEGQGLPGAPEKYRTAGLAIPMGAGLKVNLASIIAINLEWGMRRTYTDYLDDVSTYYADPLELEELNGDLAVLLADQSLVKEGVGGTNAGMQRGDQGRRDWYNFTHITLSFRIDKKPGTCWK